MNTERKQAWFGLLLFGGMMVFLLTMFLMFGLQGIWQRGSLVVTIHVVFGLCYVVYLAVTAVTRYKQIRTTPVTDEPHPDIRKRADAVAAWITLSIVNLLCLFFFVFYMIAEQSAIPVFFLWMILIISAAVQPAARSAVSLVLHARL